MKIAILSMQRIVNYGSVLQAYSLRKILEDVTNGEVAYLDIETEPALESRKTIPDHVDYAAEAAYPSGILQKGKRWLIARLSARNKHLIKKFMNEELGLTGKANDEAYDFAVVGSDEVFNHKNGVCLQLHGEVTQAKRVISYAASCGSACTEDIAEKDKSRVRTAMRRFLALSVRDKATEKYVSALYDGDVTRHLDPVLVGDLSKRVPKPVHLNRYLLVYAYGQRIRTAEEINAIQAFAKKKGLKTVAMGGSQFWCDLYIPAAPMRMLDYFYHADYVVTDTFHGAIFSIINKKKFAAIARKTNRAKLVGLLEDLSLTDRLLETVSDLEKTLVAEIDYDAVGEILERERQRTRNYLKEHLCISLDHVQPKKDLSDCSGCGACMSVCPKNAIVMEENDYGCRYPVVDEGLCIHCGKCLRVCGFQTENSFRDTIEAYAAFGRKEELVRKSTSGGIFTSLAEMVLNSGGMVAGAVMDIKDGRSDVYHVVSDKAEDLARMQGSKYVQSEAYRSFARVKETLEQGVTVLFSGTPCQVAATKTLTGDPDNLITMDLVCHGVPTKRMFNEYLAILGKYLRGKVMGICFRDKSASKAYTARIETEMKKRRSVYRIRSTYLSAYALFLDGAISRESCHHCPYASDKRVSDITVGDYWGIEVHHEQQIQSGQMPKREDWSCVLVNTEKGKTFLQKYKSALELYPTEACWVREKNNQLNEPAKKSKDRTAFLQAYGQGGYAAVEAMFVRKNGGVFRFYRRMKKNMKKIDG